MSTSLTQLHMCSAPQSHRLCVAELVDRQAELGHLRRHIGAELKRLNAVGLIILEDVFQETILHGLDPERTGPRGEALVWLKSIATRCIMDDLRKYRLRSGPNIESVPEPESSVVMENSPEDADIVEAAIPYLNPRERRLLQVCRQGLSAKALASTLGLPNAKAARDAKSRLFKKIRNLTVASRDE